MVLLGKDILVIYEPYLIQKILIIEFTLRYEIYEWNLLLKVEFYLKLHLYMEFYIWYGIDLKIWNYL